jgi:DNA (cytosine-5)-methyltransferase 1
LQRHLFWSNFNITDVEIEKDNIRTAQIPDLQKKYGYDLSGYKLSNKRQVLRNCVEPKLGEHILKCSQIDDVNVLSGEQDGS